jgi:predicted glycosyltransferase
MTQLGKMTIWIDLDNTPHVPFFKPIIVELEQRGYQVTITTRDAYQTKELADYHHLTHTCVGKHAGKYKSRKILSMLSRSLALARVMTKHPSSLAICHGSRSQLVASKILHIRSVLLTDYEYAHVLPFFRFSYRIIPQILADANVFTYDIPTFTYHGIKEDVYVPYFKPRKNVYAELNLSDKQLIILIRPPATEAHYHVAESDSLFKETMNYLLSNMDLVVVMLPRSRRQQLDIELNWSRYIENRRIIIPRSVMDGLELIWISDLVISGGGTMNREASALGVPVYSIFRGHIGAIDTYLNQHGKLFILNNKEDLKNIVFQQRNKCAVNRADNSVLWEITGHIQQCLHFSNQKA